MRKPTRSEMLSTRLRERERALLEAAARLRGVYVSELVREASLKAARRELIRERENEEIGGD